MTQLIQSRKALDSLYRYAYWHCGEEVLARSLARDSLDLAASMSESEDALDRLAVRSLRRELKYLDRLEQGHWDGHQRIGRHAFLQDRLNKLDFDDRDIVVFHLICGYGVHEMADILGVTRREVRHRVAAAGREMRKTSLDPRVGHDQGLTTA